MTSLPLSASRLKVTPVKCPICEHEWTRLNGSTYETLVNDLVKTVRRLQQATTGEEQAHLGCRVKLEISPEQTDT